MRSFVGKTVEAITLHSAHSLSLSSRGEGVDSLANQCGGIEEPAVFTEALTDNYLKLRLKGLHAPNRWMTAKVEQVEDGALVGAISSIRQLNV
jgi:hypothetical protein